MNGAEKTKTSILTIRPTQLYISRHKYDSCSGLFHRQGFESHEPVPVKRIGNDLFFTDGHTRALLLWQNGVAAIHTVEDTDDMDWIAYLANLQWCRDAGVQSIKDLSYRIVTHEVYREKWIARCEKLHEKLIRDPLGDLEMGFERDPESKHRICNEVLRALPKWFGIEEAIREYAEAVRDLVFATASLYGKTVGFCAVKTHYGINADLYVLGVFQEFHGLGIGTRLVGFIEDYCREAGTLYMTVKTLGDRHPSEEYARTRRFYERCGFRPLEEFPTLWGAANPCLYMLKKIE